MAEPANNPEHLDGPAAFAQLARITSLGDLPVTVTTAAHHPRPGLTASVQSHLEQVWDDGQAHWAGLSSASDVVRVDDAGHFLHVDQPAVIAAEFERLLARAQGS